MHITVLQNVTYTVIDDNYDSDVVVVVVVVDDDDDDNDNHNIKGDWDDPMHWSAIIAIVYEYHYSFQFS